MSQALILPTKPGEVLVVDDLPFAEYLAIDAVSATLLKALCIDHEAQVDYRRRHPKFTEPMEEGQILHTFLLEPQRFAREYRLEGTCVQPLKTGKRAGQPCGSAASYFCEGSWYCGTHRDGRETSDVKVLSQDLYNRLLGVWPEVHRVFPQISAPETRRELTLIWVDEETGLLCKARLDVLASNNRIIDVKKCVSAEARIFGFEMTDYRWDVQAAWYEHGAMKCLDDGLWCFEFLGVELNKDKFNSCQLLIPDDDTMQRGRADARAAIHKYVKCRQTGIWPAYSAEPKLVRTRKPFNPYAA